MDGDQASVFESSGLPPLPCTTVGSGGGHLQRYAHKDAAQGLVGGHFLAGLGERLKVADRLLSALYGVLAAA